MNQKDIVSTVAERIKEIQIESPPKANSYLHFNNSIVKLLTCALELDLQDDEMIQSLISDEFISQVYGDNKTVNKLVEESYSMNINM